MVGMRPGPSPDLVEKLRYGPQRYLDNQSHSDQTTSFIHYDTEVNAVIHTFYLRDADHAEGMHYWIKVTSNSTGTLTIRRDWTGSAKTISGRFAGQTLNAATSVVVAAGDDVLRIKPDGDNWIIY